MKASVEIPDTLYRQLNKRAMSERISINELILRGLEQVLKGTERKRRRRVKLPLVRSRRPGTLVLDNAKIFAAISFP